ncbi:MAG TPA: hypothetical protein VF171_04250, partial [Trueperaceae bacterium]
VLTLFGAFVAFALGALLGAIVLACGLLLIGTAVASAVALKRWQPDKLLNAKKWEAYKRFLSDFSMMRQAPAEHYKLWDYHFVYATALGVSKDYLKNLRRLMETEPDRFVIPTWIALHPGLGPSSTPSNLDALTGSLNTLSQIETNLNDLSSALSPKTSTGGGFGGSSGGFSGGFSGGGGSSGMR